MSQKPDLNSFTELDHISSYLIAHAITGLNLLDVEMKSSVAAGAGVSIKQSTKTIEILSDRSLW